MPDSLHLYRTPAGPVVGQAGRYARLGDSWDDLVNATDLLGRLRDALASGPEADAPTELLAPIGSQEVWAAGVTYLRSKAARMEESKATGGADVYDRVYDAERPELFFKATPHRVAGPGQPVRVRRDSRWSVPEPELALVVNARAEIIGYTVGNDMSARDIEGENPLYLPQAKVYDACCGLGPAVLVSDAPPGPETAISLAIERGAATAFEGATTLAQLKRSLDDLVSFLFRDNQFPAGCVLLTGTGIVPPDDFTLHSGDVVHVTIDGIGTLTNSVVQNA